MDRRKFVTAAGLAGVAGAVSAAGGLGMGNGRDGALGDDCAQGGAAS